MKLQRPRFSLASVHTIPNGDNIVSKRLLPTKAVRAKFGDISDMTLWRWIHSESLGFPQPTMIRNRRYWDADEIEAFRERMVGAGISKRAAKRPQGARACHVQGLEEIDLMDGAAPT